MTTYVDRADGHDATGAIIRCKPGYDLRYQNWEIDERRVPGRTVPLQRLLHARDQLRGAERSRDSRWRSSCSVCRPSTTGAVATPGTASSQFEIASPGEFTPEVARLLPAGRLAREPIGSP